MSGIQYLADAVSNLRVVPVLTLTFDSIPSVNEYIAQMKRDRQEGAKFEKKWRSIGHRTIEPDLNVQRESNIKACARADGTTGIRRAEPMIRQEIFLLYRVYKRNRQVKDSSLNLYTKPIEDGITDAGLWPGDDDRYVTGKLVVFGGVDKNNPRVELTIYAQN